LKKGTGKPKLSDALKATLLDLVSNKNRQVRLKTAQLLALMWELNSAQRLLGQLEVETDAAVKQELFVALGGACYFASLSAGTIGNRDGCGGQAGAVRGAGRGLLLCLPADLRREGP